MKKIRKITAGLILVSVLSLMPIRPSYADDGTPPPDPSDVVTIKKEVSMPGPGGRGLSSGGAVNPSAVQPAPGGGTLTAVAGIQTGAGLIRGYGQSILSPDVLLLWKICVQVES